MDRNRGLVVTPRIRIDILDGAIEELDPLILRLVAQTRNVLEKERRGLTISKHAEVLLER